MPILKIGQQWYNDKSKDIYLLQGTATMDGEDAPVNGKDHGKVSVAAVQNADGSTVFVTVNGWRNHAQEVASVRKRDSVFAIGTLTKREYNGKTYYDLDADFLSVSGRGYATTPNYDMSLSLPPIEFPELNDEDSGLPF